MLLRQDRGGDQVGHLFSLLHRLERRPQCDLRLPVAHIPADQTVHDLMALHILFGILDGRKLPVRLLIGEHLLKFPLPDRIRPIRVTVRLLPDCVELHQFFGDVLHRATDFRFCTAPFRMAQFIELDLSRIRAGVFLQHIQLGGQDIQVAAALVFQLDIILEDPVHFHLLDPPVDAQPMVLMDHVIPHGELGEILDPLAAVFFFLFLLFLFPAEDIRLRDHRKLDQRILKPPQCMPIGRHDLPRLQHPPCVLRIETAQALI